MTILTLPQYWAVVDGKGTLLIRTVSRTRREAKEKAGDYLPAGQQKTWRNCDRLAFRAVKVAIAELER